MKTSRVKPLPYTRSKNPVVILEHVMQAILDEPKRYHQRKWVSFKTNDMKPAQQKRYPACGTMACVAGWTCLLTRRRFDSSTADRLLGGSLFRSNDGITVDLFDGRNFAAPIGSRTYAICGVRRILRFMKQKWNYVPKPALLKRLT